MSEDLNKSGKDDSNIFYELMKDSPVILFTADLSGIIIHASRHACVRTGFSENEIIGKNFISLHPVHSKDEVNEILIKLSGEIKKSIVPIVAKNGEEIPVTTVYKRGRRDDKDAVFVMSIEEYNNVKNNSKFMKLFNFSSNITAIMKLDDFELIEVNDAFLKFFNLKRGEVIGKKFQDLGIIVDEAVINGDLEKLNKDGFFKNEENLIEFNGRKITGLVSSQIIYVSGIKSILIEFNDITDFREIENRIKTSEKNFRNIFENYYDGFLITDEYGRIASVNKAFKLITGYKGEEIIGKYVWEFQSEIMPAEKRTGAYVEKLKTEVLKLLETGTFEDENKILEGKVVNKLGVTLTIQNVSIVIKTGRGFIVASLFRNVTENKKLDDKLKHSEEMFNKLNSTMPDVVIMSDLNGGIEYASSNVCKLLDIDSPKKIIGMNYFDFIIEEDRERAKENLKRRLLTNNIGIVEYSCYNFDKTKIFPLEINGDILKDESGRPYGLIFVIREVSEKKYFERIKEEEANNYKFLSMTSVVLMKLNNTRNIFSYIGLVLKEIIGDCVIFLLKINNDKNKFNIADIVGMDNITLNILNGRLGFNLIEKEYESKDDFIERYLNEYDNLLENPDNFFAKIISKEAGDLMKINNIYTIGMKGHSSVIGGVQVLTLNDNRIKNPNLIEAFIHQASIAFENCSFIEKLSLSEEKFRELAENTDQVFWLKTDNEVLFVNSVYEKIWGRSCKSLYENPKSFLDSIHNEDKERIYNAMISEKFSREGLFDEEYRIQRPDETIRWVWARTFPIRDDKGALIRRAGIAEDITNRKFYEEIIVRAKLDAEEANRVKSRFLANMSHEIRTPLSVITGFMELLNKTELSQETRDYVMHSLNASSMLMYLINDILDFSRIEADKLKIDKIKFNLHEAIDNSIRQFIPKILEKNIIINCNINPALPENVVGDSARIKQILNNLISNAVKFTAKGEITVNADPVETTDDGTQIKFEVIDTGIGITECNIKKLFNPFTQIDSSTTRMYQGAGLGLAISKKLVEMMGGKIGVASIPGKGARFYFTVNFNKPAGDDKKEIPEYRKKLSGLNVLFVHDELAGNFPVKDCLDEGGCKTFVLTEENEKKGKGTILIVEDVDLNVVIISKILKSHGYACDSVNNGMEAVNVCKSRNYDIILMDCQMPVMDGYEATSLIRKLEKNTRHAFIIAMTAYAMNGDREKCIEAGMDEYLSKPLDFQALVDMINNYFASKEKNNKQSAVNLAGDAIKNLAKINNFDLEFSEKLFEEYIKLFDETITLIKESFKNENFENAAKLSHKMKGASGNMALKILFEKFISLEKKIKEGNKDDAISVLRDIEEYREKLIPD